MCDVYARFVLLLLKNEEVGKLGCELFDYMWGLYALETNPSTDGKRSAVFTGISKHSLNQELNESLDANLIRRNRIELI